MVLPWRSPFFMKPPRQRSEKNVSFRRGDISSCFPEAPFGKKVSAGSEEKHSRIIQKE